MTTAYLDHPVLGAQSAFTLTIHLAEIGIVKLSGCGPHLPTHIHYAISHKSHVMTQSNDLGSESRTGSAAGTTQLGTSKHRDQ